MTNLKNNIIIFSTLIVCFMMSIALFCKYSKVKKIPMEQWSNQVVDSAELQYSLDEVKIGRLSIKFKGWAFLEKHDLKAKRNNLAGDIQENREKQVSSMVHRGPIEIGLENIDSRIMYISKCDKKNREDVGKHFNDHQYNRTGISTVVNRIGIPHGKYRLYFIFDTGNGNKFIKSDNDYNL